ncbi:MAG: hypothetical protein K8F58_14805 [Bauldia sp.]|nr:hypothetical protein [Bauldia sp.]
MARPLRTLHPLAAIVAAVLTGSAAGAAEAIEPCALLTAEQVATVIPDAGEGDVDHAGPALIAGVDAYQCSLLNATFDLLTVVLNVAADDESFADLEPSLSLDEGDERLDIADGGRLHGDADDLKVTVIKGRTVIDLELLAAGARSKSGQLIDLARAIAEQLS